MSHASGAPAYGLRLRCGGKVIAYSGDTQWTEGLVELARGADLFICEAYVFEKSIKYHLTYATLLQHRAQFSCGRMILTHASADMLDRRAEVDIQMAEDGLIIDLKSAFLKHATRERGDHMIAAAICMGATVLALVYNIVHALPLFLR